MAWDEACERAGRHGVRNSQATVLAPTGTIGLLMDCDTTGIEPDLGLVKSKRLVGGGTMQMVNTTVPRALRRLGYDDEQIERITDHIAEHHGVAGAPLGAEHREIFACSLGDDAIRTSGHIEMMAAVQPFLSGAISKTVNMPADATVDDVEQLFIDAWRLGLKSVAIYRDSSKVAQPLTVGPAEDSREPGGAALSAAGDPPVGAAPPEPVRRRLPKLRRSRTFEFRVADCKGFVTVGEYPDGRSGEIFVKVSKQGSTLAGIMDAFAISLSHGLQYGVPLAAFVETFVGVRFEPAGITDDPDIRIATSLMDYLFRKLAVIYLTPHRAGRAGCLHHRRADPAHPARRRGAGRRDQAGPRPSARPAVDPLTGAADGPARLFRGGRTRGAGRLGPPQPAGRTLLHDLRRSHAPRRLVLRVRRLRRHQRLQLTPPRVGLGYDPSASPLSAARAFLWRR